MDMLLGLIGTFGFLLALVGLIAGKFLWMKSRKQAAISLAIFFVLFVIGVAMPSGDQPEPTTTGRTADPPTSVETGDNDWPVPTYQVVKREDISVARAKRFRINIAVEPGSDEATIKAAVEDVVESAKESDKAMAVVVFVYDRPQDVGLGFTLAKAEWAPNGKWGDAVETPPGNYSKHQYVWEFRKKVSDPDGVPRPTDRQFELHDAFWAILDAEPELEEADAIARVAEDYGVSIEEVQAALDAHLRWTFY